MRIALWNGSGLNNVGDRLIDAVTRKELGVRLPQATFESFSPWPGRSPQHTLRIDTEGYWNAHGQFDSIVIGGGALITGPPFSDPAAQYFLFGPYPERFQDSAQVVWNAMCSDGQTLAPSQPRWRSFICSAASRVSLLTVRNARTRSYLRDCGVSQPVSVVPDVAVLASEPSVKARGGRRLRIGIAPGRPVFPRNFLDEIATNAFANRDTINPEMMRQIQYCPPGRFDDEQYANSLVSQLSEIRAVDFVVFSSDCMYGDSLTAALIAPKLNPSSCVRLEDPLGADAISAFRSLDCVIAFRLHDCIKALVAGTPFIAVDLYRKQTTETTKLQQFMADAGFESRYLTLDELISNAKSLPALVASAISEGNEEMVSVHRGLAAKARSHFDVMAETIASRVCVAVG